MRWDDDPYNYDEPEFFCDACRDLGWLECDDRLIPCSECSAELTLDDVMEDAHAC